jgi:flagellar hook-associated protein 3 FlgL
MTISGIGDASQFFRLRRDGSSLQADMERLTMELSTGKRADLGVANGGSFTALADISRSLTLNRSFAEAISTANLDATGRQATLDLLANEISGFAPQLLSFSAGGSLGDLMLANADAGDRFAHAATALNTRLGGRSLFAGDAPDRAAIISGDAMLDALRPIAAGAGTVEDLVRDVEAWFVDPGGGFETLAWQGGNGAPAPVILSEGTQENAAITALDPAIREALAGLALAALADEGVGPSGEANTRALISAAALRMQSGESAVIALRAQLGATQARIEDARVQTETTRAVLEMERNRLMEADPYRTATDLEAVQTRLESLYILTSRLSRLSLSEYLR